MYNIVGTSEIFASEIETEKRRLDRMRFGPIYQISDIRYCDDIIYYFFLLFKYYRLLCSQ